MTLAIAAVLLALTQGSATGTLIETEVAKPLKPTGSLGTCGYKPSPTEATYFDKLGRSEVVTGSFMEPYSIHGKKAVYVSWFAIVRRVIRDDQAEGHFRLLLEHKYFDGLTDCHIMLVSANGSGDFLADVASDGTRSVPLLGLVRVYGKVIQEERGIPLVAVDYMRVWPWFTFTLTDLGPKDHGNPQWRKLCKSCQAGRIYNPYPTEEYYLNTLGDPKDVALNPTKNK